MPITRKLTKKMEPPKRKPSFDITEDHYAARPHSPAPTYRSNLPSDNEETENFHATTKDSKSVYPADEKTDHTAFTPPRAEPFDTNHPHYAPPTQGPIPSLPPQTPPIQQTRRPHITNFNLHTLLPWALSLLFFLSTLWLTSIALGIRLYTSLSPTTNSAAPASPINIIINQDGAQFTPSVETPPPPTSTTEALVPGNGVDVDLGSNTITKRAWGGEGGDAKPTSGFVTVTQSGS